MSGPSSTSGGRADRTAARGPRVPAARAGRAGRRRDRHDRGMRGPAVVPRVPGRPETRTDRDRFDDLVLAVAADLEERWNEHLGLVEYAVEETPTLPADWDAERVPLSTLVRGGGARPHRVVVFRRPVEHRCESRSELEDLVLLVVVEQVAELLGLDAATVDPRVADLDDPDSPDNG